MTSEEKKAVRDARGKRRKWTKSKRASLKQMQREEIAVKAITKATQMELSEKQLKRSKRLFRTIFPEGAVVSHPPAFWSHIQGNEGKFAVRRANEAYLKALQVAYAIFEYVCCTGPNFFTHVMAICERLKIRPTSSRFDLLKAILELVIDYSEVLDDKPSVDRSSISRDAIAIRYLMQQGVRSYAVMKYQAQYGGGVDKWSRLASKPNQIDGTKPPSAPVTEALADHDEEERHRQVTEIEDGEPSIVAAWKDRFVPCRHPERCTTRHFLVKGKVPKGEGLLLLLEADDSKQGGHIVKVQRVGALPVDRIDRRTLVDKLLWKARIQYGWKRKLKSTPLMKRISH